MPHRLLAFSCLVLLGAAACGEDGGGGDDAGGGGEILMADPAYFAAQTFDCDPATEAPACPPFTCEVDVSGAVLNCDAACNPERPETAFVGPEGASLCVPEACRVTEEGAAAECDHGVCSETDVTTYVFEFPECE